MIDVKPNVVVGGVVTNYVEIITAGKHREQHRLQCLVAARSDIVLERLVSVVALLAQAERLKRC